MNEAKRRNMKGDIKPFNIEEHDLFDQKGKTAFSKFLNKNLISKNLRTIENPNIHGIDLLTLNEENEVVYCWEIEVRAQNWIGDRSFPFDIINCIERKEYQWAGDDKFKSLIPYVLSSKYKAFYVQMNDLCNRCVVIEGKTILKCKKVPWDNRKARAANIVEYVRRVPLKYTQQWKIKDIV